MQLSTCLSIILYFSVVSIIGFFSLKKRQTATDFIIGGRSLNFWLTALAAHASDMGNWLFMGYPGSILVGGIFNAWAAIGLIIFMYLNWQFVATKIRTQTEKYNSLTFSSFFESRLSDTSGLIRIFTSLFCFIFYSIYIAVNLMGVGFLFENLFHLNYEAGLFTGASIIIGYVLIGGYRTLAWIDLFQGIFLMCVIVFVPLYLLPGYGGMQNIIQTANLHKIPLTLIPKSGADWIQLFSLSAGWGLGYFGQPHVITKFMGIKHVGQLHKSKWVGMSWMLISLSAATFVGLVGVAAFNGSSINPEQLFVKLVENNFSPFFVGIMLCAVLAAIINQTSSQVLVLTSTLTEDFYKKLLRKNAPSAELLLVSRIGVILVCLLACIIALGRNQSIYDLVLYAWSGLGSSFGPLLLFCLYSKTINRFGAWAGILIGGIVSATWPYLGPKILSFHLDPLIPGFILSSLAIIIGSLLTKHKNNEPLND